MANAEKVPSDSVPRTPAERSPDRVTARNRRRIALETRRLLAERFPLCFMPKGAPKLPLALGIRQAIRAAAPDIKSDPLHFALCDYCATNSYLAALVAGAPRVGLDGAPQGSVTEADAEQARKKLARRQERMAAMAA